MLQQQTLHNKILQFLSFAKYKIAIAQVHQAACREYNMNQQPLQIFFHNFFYKYALFCLKKTF